MLWDSLRERLSRGEHPSNKELAEYLRRWPPAGMPPYFVEYFASRLDGTLKPRKGKKGRPARSDTETEAFYVAYGFANDVRTAQVAFRILGLRDPLGRAVSLVARERKKAESTVRGYLKLVPEPRAAMADRIRQAKDLVARGYARMDPKKGWVWIHLPDEYFEELGYTVLRPKDRGSKIE